MISFDTKTKTRENDFIKIEDTPSRLISRTGVNTKLSIRIHEKFINSFNSSIPRRFSDIKSKHRKNSFLEKLKEKMANPPKPIPPPSSPIDPLKKRRSTNESVGSFFRLGGVGSRNSGKGRKDEGAKFLKVELWKERKAVEGMWGEKGEGGGEDEERLAREDGGVGKDEEERKTKEEQDRNKKGEINEDINPEKININSFSSSSTLSRIPSKMRSALQDIKSKLKRKVLVQNENDQSFLGTTAWKSLVNISEFFPVNSRFKQIIATFSENLGKWRNFFFSSLRDSYRDQPHVVPEMPDNLEKDISFVEIMILIKHIRPEELENFLCCSEEAVKKCWERGESSNDTFKKDDPLEEFTRGTEQVVIVLHSGDELTLIEGIELRGRRKQKKCFKIWIENEPEEKIARKSKKKSNMFEGLFKKDEIAEEEGTEEKGEAGEKVVARTGIGSVVQAEVGIELGREGVRATGAGATGGLKGGGEEKFILIEGGRGERRVKVGRGKEVIRENKLLGAGVGYRRRGEGVSSIGGEARTETLGEDGSKRGVEEGRREEATEVRELEEEGGGKRFDITRNGEGKGGERGDEGKGGDARGQNGGKGRVGRDVKEEGGKESRMTDSRGRGRTFGHEGGFGRVLRGKEKLKEIIDENESEVLPKGKIEQTREKINGGQMEEWNRESKQGQQGRWKELYEKMRKTAECGEWLVIRNFESIGEKDSRILHRRISDLLRDRITKPSFKIFILTKVDEVDRKPINLPDGRQKQLSLFLSTFSPIYIPFPSTLKAQMTSLYTLELQDFQFQQEVKIQLRNSPRPGLMMLENLRSEYHDWRIFRKNVHKRSESINLLSFLDLEKSHPLIIENYSDKIKYILRFLFSLLHQRSSLLPSFTSFLPSSSCNYPSSLSSSLFLSCPPFLRFLAPFALLSPGVNNLEINDLVEDILGLLKNFPLDPFVFIEKYLCFLFGDRDGFNSIIIKKFLSDYFTPNLEKDVVIDVKDFKYKIFNNFQTTTVEENIYKNISTFPPLDPIEIFGFDQNKEIILNYRKSEKMMNYISNTHRRIKDQETEENKISSKLQKIKNAISKMKETYEEKFSELNKYYIEFLKKRNDNDRLLKSIVEDIIELTQNNYTISDLKFFRFLTEKPFLKTRTQLDAILAEWTAKTMIDRTRIKRTDQFLSQQHSDGFNISKKKNTKIELDNKLKIMEEAAHLEENDEDFEGDLISEDESTPKSSECSFQNENNSNESEVLKSIILNETIAILSLKKTLRSWMLRILSYLNGNPLLLPSLPQSFSPSSSFLHPPVSSQLLPSFSVLSDFLKTFLAKMEHLNKVVLGRDCEVFPVIPMGKIFEPMNLIFSYLLHTAKKLKCSVMELKIVAVRSKNIESKQNFENGLTVSGFVLKGGRLNEANNYLEEENFREFNYDFPILQLSCKKKVTKIEDLATDSSLTIEISDSKPFSYDYDFEHFRQLKKPPSFFHYTNKTLLTSSLNKQKKMEKNEKTTYFVKLPLNERKGGKGIATYVYAKSFKPQEYWVKKGTEVVFES